MCGIAANLGPNVVAGENFIAGANRLLTHRGPDDEGIFVGGGIVLGHRRLSILDLTQAAHQPMQSPDGRWAIVYNGEVYNHQQLRAKLCQGWEFKSRSDTETVLAALALHGPAAFEEMVGMWALALWDAKERRLLISRDRYGQKPLYWRVGNDGSLRFASEIRPLIETGESPAMYAPAVAEYLATGNYGHLGNRTFFRDVYSFPPAHWAYVTAVDRTVRPTRYWRFPIAAKKDRRPYDETARRAFRRAFEEAVDSQLMSDVTVGATLSGGLDSSAVVGALASQHGDQRIPVFTAQAEGSALDETRYVKAVEKHWNGRLQICWVQLKSMPLAETIHDTIRSQEGPFGDPSIVAHGLLMDAARAAGVSVILGGQGGDELLFGYTFMAHTLLATSLQEGNVRWAVSQARLMDIERKPLLRVALAVLFPSLERAARRRSRLERRSWLSVSLKESACDESPTLATTSDAEAVWLETVERFALPHLTHYDDRSSMARSIEGRMPFLDHRLAAVVGSLKFEAFLDGGQQKRILRDACRDLLPAAVLERRDKIGFFTPLQNMLKAESEWVGRLVTDEYARGLNLYDGEMIGSCLNAIAQGNGRSDAAHLVWRALSMRIWAEMFNVQPLT